MSDTITEHYRPYLEGGVVLFLIPSNLHTVNPLNYLGENYDQEVVIICDFEKINNSRKLTYRKVV